MTETYPCLITSLVTLIFLVHPKHKSSSLHWIFFSTSGGFLLTVVCENIIGVVDLRLRLLDKETAGIGSVFSEIFMPASFVGEPAWYINSGSEMSNLLLLLDKEPEIPLLLIILLRGLEATSVAVLRLELLDREVGVGVVHRLLPILERGLVGVGVLDLLLAVLDKNLGLQMSSSTLLLSLCSKLWGVISSYIPKIKRMQMIPKLQGSVKMAIDLLLKIC